jgi:hypothetical protein
VFGGRLCQIRTLCQGKANNSGEGLLSRIQYFWTYVGWARGRLPQADYDCAGRPSVPIAFKVLGASRIVSKGWAFD